MENFTAERTSCLCTRPSQITPLAAPCAKNSLVKASFIGSLLASLCNKGLGELGKGLFLSCYGCDRLTFRDSFGANSLISIRGMGSYKGGLRLHCLRL